MKVINVDAVWHILDAYSMIPRSDDRNKLMREGIERNCFEITDHKPHERVDNKPACAPSLEPHRKYLTLADVCLVLVSCGVDSSQYERILGGLKTYCILNEDLKRLVREDLNDATNSTPQTPMLDGRFQALFKMGYEHVSTLVLDRAAQYTDTYAYPSHNAYAAVTGTSKNARAPRDEQKRIIGTQIDLKYDRLAGGLKSDTVYDLAAFALALAGLIREEEKQVELALEYKRKQPELPIMQDVGCADMHNPTQQETMQQALSNAKQQNPGHPLRGVNTRL